ncbi:class I SAM-dependent methyltransferase [Azospirillum sp. B2RO_4]|uniref:class I SAM-dependent methyltransferase n=1 Tax=Azospirillum sp. B2RO_4 TaxID=3027796 RepID=UPI003DA95F1C
MLASNSPPKSLSLSRPVLWQYTGGIPIGCKNLFSATEGRVMGRLSYLFRCLGAQTRPERYLCPNCGCAENSLIERKYFVTQLRRCGSCAMLFRTPTDDPANNQSFYETSYSQGFTTELPDPDRLRELVDLKFAGTEKSYAHIVDIILKILPSKESMIFDYGCSWGYGSWQIKESGYSVTSFEIDRNRSAFARENLRITTVDDMDEFVTQAGNVGQYDCFFSSHVLEHVPSPSKVFHYANKLLKAGGLFLSFTPNGSFEHRAASDTWSSLWGEVHPNFIDPLFLDRSFSASPRSIASSPISEMTLPAEPIMTQIGPLDGDELVFCARKVKDEW